MSAVRASLRVVAATKPKAKTPAKKAPAAANKAKNKWVNNTDGFDASKFYGPDRKLFLPGGLLDPSEVPAYLDGSLPGECVHGFSGFALSARSAADSRRRSYGYDPLGLGKDGNVEKYREYEVRAERARKAAPAARRRAMLQLTDTRLCLASDALRALSRRFAQLMHARWAMLGAFGALLPEALSAFGGDSIPGAVWWQVRPRIAPAPRASAPLARATARRAPGPRAGGFPAARRPRIARRLRCFWSRTLTWRYPAPARRRRAPFS